MINEVLVDVGSLGTAVGVAVTAGQLWFNRRQARTQFEDGLTARYREIVRELPIGAFLDDDSIPEARGVFYRYFDLCNEQAFLHEQGRISSAAWEQWRDGIESNMRRGAFKAAWLEIESKIGSDFDEFRRVLSEFTQ